MRWTISRVPGLEDSLRELAEKHRELKDEPLHLALAYDPGRGTQDLFLFELLSHFGGDRASPDRELFEISYDPTLDIPLTAGRRMHLVLTSPAELRESLKQRWPSAMELQAAIARGDFEILVEDDLGRQALELLQSGPLHE